ncbi:class I SAM-dependent methyltransferase [Streptomyces acidiscabies]|uniref:class I SAM-dependent methyltransferase n=1 Tax=Streptomyces acidiscabies TaxID=42234 RepID=UPI00073F9029|nr:class I SAM-dependent methyltransferase [Streptomyces acidiscabies]GAQ53055.1 carminomycin 4-O-methyltransferase [Streptomyces acidiscabies]
MPDTAGPHIGPQEVFTTLTGFKKTAMLRTALELGLFDAVGEDAPGARQIAERLGTDPRATGFLLDALASVGLLAGDGSGYRLPPGAAPLLTSTGPRYVGGLARIAASHGEWEVFGRLTETVRTGAPLAEADAQAPDFAYWTDFAQHPTPATAKGAALVADLLEPLDAPDVLDVGCGSGAFGLTLAARHPGARTTLQDWPSVLQIAHRRAKEQGLDDRVALSPGDVFGAGLPGGSYDVVVAGNLLFLFDPGRAEALVRRLAGALRPGGRLVIASFMTGEGATDAEHAHLLNLLMLSWTPGGELLPPSAYQEMATRAGLTDARVHRREGVPLQAVVATRPTREEGPA